MSRNSKIGKKGLIVYSQAKEIIDRVTKFFEREAKEGITVPLNKVKERVLEANSISKNTYYQIRKESAAVLENGNSSFESP